jgi:hypothetical protein
MWKRHLRLAMTIALLGMVGFLLPLTSARRITLTGIVFSFTALGLGATATSWLAQEYGLLLGIAGGFTMNIAVAVFWLWLVCRVTIHLRREQTIA